MEPTPKKRLTGKQLAAAAAAVAVMSAPLTMQSEGKKNVAYMDRLPTKPTPTTCFGHTGPEVKVGHFSTDRECTVMLEGDQTKAAVEVYQLSPAEIADRPQIWAAMTDFAYNLGSGTYARSSILQLFKQGRWADGCRRIPLYNKAGGRVLRGLTIRRNKEMALCLKGASA